MSTDIRFFLDLFLVLFIQQASSKWETASNYLDPQIPELELGSSPEQTSINHPKNTHRDMRDRERGTWHKNRKQAGLKFKSNLPVYSIPLSLSLSLSFSL